MPGRFNTAAGSENPGPLFAYEPGLLLAYEIEPACNNPNV
jgi:hypothetical protein